MTNHLLEIDILELWQAGSGRGEGSFLDSVPVLDADGLPYLPGRTLKGLLRDAVRALTSFGGCTTDMEELLFGTRGDSDRYTTKPGALRVGDARLPHAVREHLCEIPAEERERRARAQQKESLFHDAFQTAIDEAAGVARNRSLRSIRLAVPMLIEAELTETAALSEKQREALCAALPLIDAVGSGRARGLGRCTVSMAVASTETSHA